jgi:hypothetical protein
LTIFFYVVASVVTASDPVALVDASLLPTRLLLVAADVRPPFLPPFLPAAAFLALDFAGLFDFPLAISLLFFRACTTLLDHMMECT